MACFHPLSAIYSINPQNNKKILRFLKGSDIEKYRNDDNFLEIPCGQCSGCRLEYSRQWAVRCVLESLKYEHCFFITLTYDDEHLVFNGKVDDLETGELDDRSLVATLHPPHLTKFMKDLREYFSYHYNHEGIRFFACGEYGASKMRPHYHLILFNLPIPDLTYFFSKNGYVHWKSNLIFKLWGKKGIIDIAECCFDTCAYVARYMMKKQKGKNKDFYKLNNLVPPFTRCSRNPGIAREYYDKNSDKIYYYDSLIITGHNGNVQKVRPPRYYDRLFDVDNPDKLIKIKDARRSNALLSQEKLKNLTDVPRDYYLSICEENFDKKCSKLIRPIE